MKFLLNQATLRLKLRYVINKYERKKKLKTVCHFSSNVWNFLFKGTQELKIF